MQRLRLRGLGGGIAAIVDKLGNEGGENGGAVSAGGGGLLGRLVGGLPTHGGKRRRLSERRKR